GEGERMVGGRRGTMHAMRVSLQSNAVVDGDIFHRVLSIDANAQFEGSSRRVENPTDAPTNSLKLDWSKAEPIRTEEKRPWGPARRTFARNFQPVVDSSSDSRSRCSVMATADTR